MDRSTLNIGWASREFTPQRPALLHGQMYVRVAREAADPLTLTALAIDGDGPSGRVILISCDLPMISEALQAAVRGQVVARLPDLAPEAIIMSGTHTHDAPVVDDGFYPHPGGDVMTAEEGAHWVIARAVEAAVEAWEQRAPRWVGRAFEHAVVGHNRRAVYADGTARLYGQTNDPGFSHVEGYEDHSLDMLFVWETDGRLSGIVLDIPCPSQVEEQLECFSADFWHDIRMDLGQRFGEGLHVLALCGAAGDQSPHFLLYGPQEEEMRRRRGVSERREIAARVGEAVTRALACTRPAGGATAVVHAWRRLTLSPRTITQAERDWAANAHAEALQRGDRPDLWWPKMLRDVVDRFDRGEPMPASQAEVHALRIGDAVIATNPFELFLDYGLQIKARSPAAQTLVVQLAAGTGLYLPTERAVRGGHYGAHPVVAPVGPTGGRELVEATLRLMESLFAPAA